MAMMLGGRVAEELKIGDYTTGASNDIQKATGLAREMVTQFGMSEELGPIKLGQKEGQPFLGRDMGHTPDYSARVAEQIDSEIRALIDEAHDEALEILVENDDVLESLAQTLLDVETLDGAALVYLDFLLDNTWPWRRCSRPPASDRRAPWRPCTVSRRRRSCAD